MGRFCGGDTFMPPVYSPFRRPLRGMDPQQKNEASTSSLLQKPSVATVASASQQAQADVITTQPTSSSTATVVTQGGTGAGVKPTRYVVDEKLGTNSCCESCGLTPRSLPSGADLACCNQISDGDCMEGLAYICCCIFLWENCK